MTTEDLKELREKNNIHPPTNRKQKRDKLKWLKKQMLILNKTKPDPITEEMSDEEREVSLASAKTWISSHALLTSKMRECQ